MLRIVLLFVAMGVLACCSTASAQDQPGDIITDGAGNLFVLVDQTGDGVPDVAVAVYPPPADPPPVDPPSLVSIFFIEFITDVIEIIRGY